MHVALSHHCLALTQESGSGQILSLSIVMLVNIAITCVLTLVAISSELQPSVQLLFHFIIFS